MPGSSCPARNTGSPSSIPVRCSPPSSPTVDAGVPVPLLAAAFHEALGTATGELAASLAAAARVDAVALTGGVFQNVRLTEVVESTLRQAGCDVLVHAEIPANDGGISIGQAAIAAWRSTMLPMVS